jgi:hypothetical protein
MVFKGALEVTESLDVFCAALLYGDSAFNSAYGPVGVGAIECTVTVIAVTVIAPSSE